MTTGPRRFRTQHLPGPAVQCVPGRRTHLRGARLGRDPHHQQAEIQQQHGFVHGGVLSYLADNALTFAGGLALGGDALTAEYKINYVRPAVGDLVITGATATAMTRRQAVCQCSVHVASGQGEERLVALAQGTIVRADKQEDWRRPDGA
ncbi:PaaI family thioesterase [Streptomyces eurythermus]|uniref:PaaI family thioesterase n=1 Tax=Streptomyces eurythermus TaxID=42237 RepID=UPI0036D3506E